MEWLEMVWIGRERNGNGGEWWGMGGNIGWVFYRHPPGFSLETCFKKKLLFVTYNGLGIFFNVILLDFNQK